jgi:DNA polymerase III subunit delta
MKPLSPEALHRLLDSGRRGGAFFLFGDEEFLKNEATELLLARHLDPATRDFNFDQLRAADASPETIASVLATPPLMAEWRVVVLRDVQAAATSARFRSTLEEMLGHKVPGLVFIMTAQIPSGRAQFYEQLKKLATPVQCDSLSDADLPGWLMDRADRRSVTLDADAAQVLAGAIGSDLGVLAQELNKLIDFAGDRQRIEAKDVHALVGRVVRQNRWEWFDLVGDRHFAQARTALPILLDSGETGVGLLIGLGSQILRIGIGAAGGERALETALPPNQKWLAKRIIRQVRGWSNELIQQALADLLRADRLLKSTSLTDLQVLEELLLRLQARSASAAA